MANDYISVTYDESRAPKTAYPQQLISYLVNRFRLSKGDRILEVGCGRGDFLKEFKSAGLEAFGVDREASAQKFLQGIEVKKCDLSKDVLPYPDNFFDVVYHKSVIEHLYDCSHLMQETKRVLKKDGKCLILTPDWWTQKDVFYEDITHCRPYDVNALKDAFVIFGFKNPQTERFAQLPILWTLKPLCLFASLLRAIIGVRLARKLTEVTGIKFFRWAVELMVLGFAQKP